jgi:hypothetical protein
MQMDKVFSTLQVFADSGFDHGSVSRWGTISFEIRHCGFTGS